MIHFCFLTGLYSRTDPLIVERQGRSLVENGFRVTYLVCDLKEKESVYGIDIQSTDYIPKNRIDRFLYSKQHVLRYALEIDADIYQISDPEHISLVRALKKKGKKVIFNLREFYPDMIKRKTYLPRLIRWVAGGFFSGLMRLYFKDYDAIITPDHIDANTLIEKYKVPHSFFVANFPRINITTPFTYEDYLQRGNVLCYEGTIYESSRQDNVFEALEGLPDVKYILAGKIDENYDWIKSLPYWRKVEFIDGFTLDELAVIFSRSSIGNVFRNFISKHGSYGIMKIFETMGAGLPVLLSDLPLYREIVNKYHCGICVNPNDVDSIRSAIKYLVDHKKEAYEMGQNGMRAVLEEYNWDNEAKKYVSIINDILITKENG